MIWAEDYLGDMVEETDNLYITRMMELAETDIWHAENVEELEHAKLAEQMLHVLKTTLKRQKGFGESTLLVRDPFSHAVVWSCTCSRYLV